MKNYYCLALTFLFVMSANSQVIRYSVLDVESENREKFIKGLKDKTIFTLEMGSLLAGAKFRGEFEERLKSVLHDLRAIETLKNNFPQVYSEISKSAFHTILDIAYP